jgi:hypothetical protein
VSKGRFEVSERKMITARDILLNEQMLQQAIAIWERGGRAAEIAKEVIEPNLEAINRHLGQENNPKYLGYAVEYVFTQLGGDR